MEQPKKPHVALATLIAVVLVGLATASVIVLSNRNESTTTVPSTVEQESREEPQNEPNEPLVETNYSNGTYEATGYYATPAGTDSIGVTIVLDDDVIVDANVEQHATSGNSAQFQSAFASGYKEQVVGKLIDEVSLSRVAGSSLTSNGFNDAVEQIKDEARVEG